MLSKELLIYLNRVGIEKQSHTELVELCNESEFRAMPTETEEKANKMATPRKQRARGFGQKQQLPVTAEKDLYPLQCSHCQHRT